jgi:hypothetical protein
LLRFARNDDNTFVKLLRFARNDGKTQNADDFATQIISMLTDSIGTFKFKNPLRHCGLILN